MLDAGEHPLFPGVVICEEPLEALAGADAAVLVTEWPEFGAPRLARPPPPRWRGRCSSTAATSSTPPPPPRPGIEYEGIGLGDEVPAPVAR